MLPLTLIAILSLGIVEGLDPYKGLLFSYYFYSFRKVKESYVVPILSSITYYMIGILIAVLLNISDNALTRGIMFFLLLAHMLIKLIMGKVLHYPGNMRPKILNVIQWSTLNSIIQMNVIVLLTLSILSKLSLILLPITVVIVRETTYCLSVKNNRILLNLTEYNFDYFYIITISLLSIVLILPLL
ncbi:hypothetical protein [Saccharolobus shibatae]|uniref:Putative integral membrane protein n=1 Tax=Saccharolobus shibatae TaxID=2286 RepID=A0A8F5GYI0_9CREN|nr:hypothetical protein [Saccharolobus shibatae]QXJ31072.1 putative integral membrane protein [Saccharolobus shibatae]QXJ34095.1 putative integral membrane protein [Saccharolobus shibatae]